MSREWGSLLPEGARVDEARMVLQVTLENDVGEEVDLELPCAFEVCPTCAGRGSHVNPAIDGNGISPEEFAEDPDFAEGYFAGHYDVTCAECRGRRVVPQVDEKKANEEHLRLLREYERAEADYRRECAYQQRMGF